MCRRWKERWEIRQLWRRSGGRQNELLEGVDRIRQCNQEASDEGDEVASGRKGNRVVGQAGKGMMFGIMLIIMSGQGSK